MKISHLLTYSFLLFIIVSCKDHTSHQTNNKETNPVDLIFSDKLINESTGEIRENNFSDFNKLLKTDLESKSKLYDIDKLSKNLFVLNQVKLYTHARSFSSIIKTSEHKVITYYLFDDYKIIKCLYNESGIFILLGNFGLNNEYWGTNNSIKLIHFDNDLNEIWNYSSNKNKFSIEPITMALKKDYIFLKVKLITGCHMCYNTYQINIDYLGNFVLANFLDKTNSTLNLNEEMISDIFE